ncbi:hypothetical protein KQX54_021588 [Cotesia glomerata]|uniref:Uncharacterized protein n=1 Tax=Cotesia glomerata TaxID=32391 RepID=A0AAV7J996_COTGL|nr:hypothetical protein KQX54_021588 [Cotesia glomerata]
MDERGTRQTGSSRSVTIKGAEDPLLGERSRKLYFELFHLKVEESAIICMEYKLNVNITDLWSQVQTTVKQ